MHLLCSHVYAADNSKIHVVFPDDAYQWLHSYTDVNFSNALSFFQIDRIGNLTNHDAADLFSWKNWRALKEETQLLKGSVPQTVYPTLQPKTMDLFGDKVRWLQFMRNSGLGAHVPTVYEQNSCDVYPCMLKNSAKHWGKGVHVVRNQSHLQEVITRNVRAHESYHLEEGLAGWGLTEASAFGSVYEGKLMSLRCILSVHTTEKVTEKDRLFVQGYQLYRHHLRHVSCGHDVLNVLSTMFTALDTPYTGVFCADFKGNDKLTPKFMEINARMCGTHTTDEKLFISSFVPLAFATRRGLLAKKNSTFVPQWYTSSKYKSVVRTEKDNLRSLKRSTTGFKLTNDTPPFWRQHEK